MTEGFARDQTGFTRKQMTELVGEKVVLFPLREEDAPLIIRWRNTKRVRDHFIYRKPFTLQSQEAWFKDEIGSGRVLQFLMVEKASKKPIGSVYFRDIDQENRTAEYGIFIGEEEALGKGYGSETADLALRFAFEQKKLRRVFLRVYCDTAAAIGSYLHAGFAVCGTNRQVQSTDGTCADMYLMELTADRYFGLHPFTDREILQDEKHDS